MTTKFEQLRALLTQEEWDNFLANLTPPESFYDGMALDAILSSAFCWQESTQGHDYWDKIWERLHNNQPAPTTHPPKTYTIEDIRIAFLDGYFEGAGDDQWYAQHDKNSNDCETVLEDSHANRCWLEHLATLEEKK